MQLPQLGAGIHAEFPGDHLAGPGVGLQGLGLPARAVQGAHEQRPQPFAEPVFGSSLRSSATTCDWRPAAQIGVDAQLQGLDPRFLEPAGRGTDQG